MPESKGVFNTLLIPVFLEAAQKVTSENNRSYVFPRDLMIAFSRHEHFGKLFTEHFKVRPKLINTATEAISQPVKPNPAQHRYEGSAPTSPRVDKLCQQASLIAQELDHEGGPNILHLFIALMRSDEECVTKFMERIGVKPFAAARAALGLILKILGPKIQPEPQPAPAASPDPAAAPSAAPQAPSEEGPFETLSGILAEYNRVVEKGRELSHGLGSIGGIGEMKVTLARLQKLSGQIVAVLKENTPPFVFEVVATPATLEPPQSSMVNARATLGLKVRELNQLVSKQDTHRGRKPYGTLFKAISLLMIQLPNAQLQAAYTAAPPSPQ